MSGNYGLRELINSGEEETTIQDLARSFLPRLRDQMVAPFKYFSPSSPLVRESIITVFQGSSAQGGNNRVWQQVPPHHHRLHPMLQRVAINLSIAEHLLDTASMHPGAKHLDRHLRAHEEEGVHEPSMPLRNVILPPKTRQKIETALKNLVRPRLVFVLSLVLTFPMRLLNPPLNPALIETYHPMTWSDRGCTWSFAAVPPWGWAPRPAVAAVPSSSSRARRAAASRC